MTISGFGGVEHRSVITRRRREVRSTCRCCRFWVTISHPEVDNAFLTSSGRPPQRRSVVSYACPNATVQYRTYEQTSPGIRSCGYLSYPSSPWLVATTLKSYILSRTPLSAVDIESILLTAACRGLSWLVMVVAWLMRCCMRTTLIHVPKADTCHLCNWSS